MNSAEAAPREALVEMREVKTYFPIRHGVFSRVTGYIRAVDGVTLRIRPGETFGLVGESGSGKTTLGRTILGLERIHEGDVIFRGESIRAWGPREWRRRRPEMQIIFQDPFASLNPRMAVMDMITEGLVEHGLLTESREAAAARLMEDVGLEADLMYRYPFEFSGGQRQRISIARALSLRPRLLVCDEPVSALDVSIQAQVINLLSDLRDKYGLTYLFITHDLSVVRHIADRIAVMREGRLVEEGETERVIREPSHPYTRALIESVPAPGGRRRRRDVVRTG
jgi:ABC-type oligopeptide transport system ATPase subunit